MRQKVTLAIPDDLWADLSSVSWEIKGSAPGQEMGRISVLLGASRPLVSLMVLMSMSYLARNLGFH